MIGVPFKKGDYVVDPLTREGWTENSTLQHISNIFSDDGMFLWRVEVIDGIESILLKEQFLKSKEKM